MKAHRDIDIHKSGRLKRLDNQLNERNPTDAEDGLFGRANTGASPSGHHYGDRPTGV
jgi:hypothetical protein